MKFPSRANRSSLNFPNEARSFDAEKARVLFWGYDTAIEISFFLEIAALRLIHPPTDETEAGLLEAFDTVRDRVHEVAVDVWRRGPRDRYAFTLTAEDV